jgi:hypothetical protein
MPSGSNGAAFSGSTESARSLGICAPPASPPRQPSTTTSSPFQRKDNTASCRREPCSHAFLRAHHNAIVQGSAFTSPISLMRYTLIVEESPPTEEDLLKCHNRNAQDVSSKKLFRPHYPPRTLPSDSAARSSHARQSGLRQRARLISTTRSPLCDLPQPGVEFSAPRRTERRTYRIPVRSHLPRASLPVADMKIDCADGHFRWGFT